MPLLRRIHAETISLDYILRIWRRRHGVRERRVARGKGGTVGNRQWKLAGNARVDLGGARHRSNRRAQPPRVPRRLFVRYRHAF